jgi:hypothetical protein
METRVSASHDSNFCENAPFFEDQGSNLCDTLWSALFFWKHVPDAS